VSVAGEKARLAMFTEFAEAGVEEVFDEDDPYPEHAEREKIAIRVTIISVGSNSRFTMLFIQSSLLFSNIRYSIVISETKIGIASINLPKGNTRFFIIDFLFSFI